MLRWCSWGGCLRRKGLERLTKGLVEECFKAAVASCAEERRRRRVVLTDVRTPCACFAVASSWSIQ